MLLYDSRGVDLFQILGSVSSSSGSLMPMAARSARQGLAGQMAWHGVQDRNARAPGLAQRTSPERVMPIAIMAEKLRGLPPWPGADTGGLRL
jgi:hypothetical protein